MTEQRLKVAVPAPFSDALDYLPGDELPLLPGMRVLVPLGRRQIVGVVVCAPEWIESGDGLRCRPVSRRLDADPTVSAEVLSLCQWAASYYHHPLGEVLAAALPGALRKPPSARARPPRARRPRAVAIASGAASAKNVLSDEQAAVVGALAQESEFQVSLLEGVTGSGKTEIYLNRVQAVLDQGRQALVLTPEIGLTPQLEARFRERFGEAVALFHSGLTERARADAWQAAREGRCRVLVGTRSAVFTPLPQLGLIVVDEEHDPSYKQQEGFRYSARDVAIVRGQRAGVPVILGSATPSLESLHNVARGRYRHLRLLARPGERRLPKVRLLDLRTVKLRDGLAPELVESISRHLDQGGQALLFVNRRGYAPALLCHDCGWLAPCPHCDARMTLHRVRGRLICHHCGSEARVPLRCGSCAGSELIPVGQGTERIEDALRRLFPDIRVERIDSDRARRAGELERLLADIRNRDIRLLVGTQMLAKGHDFDGLTLVGVVDVDQALYSGDFRAVERMGQLLTQVAGRAGRGAVAGEVIVQTHQPDHPQLQCWLREGYAGLSKGLLEERRDMGYPPSAHLALLRADALDAGAALQFLKSAASEVGGSGGVDTLGPIPAPMERRANRFRAQLLLRSANRAALQRSLTQLVPRIGALPGARKLRWSIDVDPIDLY
jgi:primosomal protein N' (replication factor Y)